MKAATPAPPAAPRCPECGGEFTIDREAIKVEAYLTHDGHLTEQRTRVRVAFCTGCEFARPF